MYTLFTKLLGNYTAREWAIAGLELGSGRCRTLSSYVAYNRTLTCLNLSRIGLTDDDGASIAQILYTNKTLRKLELEGNKLGQKTMVEFANSLLYNTTLKCLDLESNKLLEAATQQIIPVTKEKDKGEMASVKPGMDVFCKALVQNKTLISLNVANNGLQLEVGKKFEAMLKENSTLIDFEFGFNDFGLEEVSQSL